MAKQTTNASGKNGTLPYLIDKYTASAKPMKETAANGSGIGITIIASGAPAIKRAVQ
jgi:hypothetical protein